MTRPAMTCHWWQHRWSRWRTVTDTPWPYRHRYCELCGIPKIKRLIGVSQ